LKQELHSDCTNGANTDIDPFVQLLTDIDPSFPKSCDASSKLYHLKVNNHALTCANLMLYPQASILEGWGCDPQILGGGRGSPWNIIISYNVQECEMKTLSKVVTCQK